MGQFPWGTFVVNVSGCFLLGSHHRAWPRTTASAPRPQTVLGTGGMGAYTTFSTFTFETVRLAEDGAVDHALRNIAANLFVGLAAAGAGLALAALL